MDRPWSLTESAHDGLFASNLSYETCRGLATQGNDPELEGLCEAFRAVDASALRPISPSTQANAFQTNCTICHSESREWWSQRKDLVGNYLQNNVMPPGEGLSEAEKSDILQYISKFIQLYLYRSRKLSHFKICQIYSIHTKSSVIS